MIAHGGYSSRRSCRFCGTRNDVSVVASWSSIEAEACVGSKVDAHRSLELLSPSGPAPASRSVQPLFPWRALGAEARPGNIHRRPPAQEGTITTLSARIGELDGHQRFITVAVCRHLDTGKTCAAVRTFINVTGDRRALARDRRRPPSRLHAINR